MAGKFRNAVLLGLSLGVSMPATTVWAETFLKIEGVAGESVSLPLERFPGGSFTPVQLRQFKGQGISLLGDLIEADPALVGRIMGVSPQQARMTQRHLRDVTREKR